MTAVAPPMILPAPIQERWYGTLIVPRLGWVNRIIGRAVLSGGIDPAGPRVGLATALASGLAWTHGERLDRKALGIGCVALEVANHHVFAGLPDDALSLAQGLEARALRSSVRRLLQNRSAVLERMLDRVTKADVGRDPIPEGVLFLRAAVALGVAAGDVPDEHHEVFDIVATWLAVASEPFVDGSGWVGAFGAIGEVPERGCALAGLSAALCSVPESAFRESLDALRPKPTPIRSVEGWVPRRAPLSSVPRGEGTLEDALDAVVAGGPAPLVDAARFLLRSGGKRMRPALVLAACASVGGSEDRALMGAAAVEWLHLASLVLDDMMDDARVRRGQATLHESTDRPFAVGVFLWLLSRVRTAAGALSPEVSAAVRRAAESLAEGQGAEIGVTGRGTIEVSDYHRVIAGKTAALFATAAEVGALSGGAAQAEVQALRSFGHELGLAFQITDDVLDYEADVRVFGKLPGTDLRAGKPTLPFLLLRDALSSEQRASLLEALGRPGGLQPVIDQMRDHEVFRQCRERAQIHAARAVAAVAPLGHPAALVQLAMSVVGRHRCPTPGSDRCTTSSSAWCSGW